MTDPEMTRFMMTLDDAVDLVMYAFECGKNGDIFVQKAPAATVKVLVQAILELTNRLDHKVSVIGSRHGEKLYEVLLGREEKSLAKDIGNYFRVPSDVRDLNYSKFVEQGNESITFGLHSEDYSSHNTVRLSVEDMKILLLKLPYVHKILSSHFLSGHFRR